MSASSMVFGGGVSGGGEFADEEEFGPFQHFLFAEGKRLGAAERNQTFQYGGHFDQLRRFAFVRNSL